MYIIDPYLLHLVRNKIRGDKDCKKSAMGNVAPMILTIGCIVHNSIHSEKGLRCNRNIASLILTACSVHKKYQW